MAEGKGHIYSVKPGDTLALIAKRKGFKRWETIFNHEKNNEVRKKHPNPHTIQAGSDLWIPDIDQGAMVKGKTNRINYARDHGRYAVGFNFGIFYCAYEQEYYVLESKDFQNYIQECDTLEKAAIELNTVQTEKIPDNLSEDELDKAIEEKEKNIQQKKDAMVSLLKSNDNEPDFMELVCLNKIKNIGKPYCQGWRRVRRSWRNKGYIRKAGRQELDKMIREAFAKEKGNGGKSDEKKFSERLIPEVKSTLFEKDIISGEGFIPLPDSWKFKKEYKSKKDAFKDSNYFDGGVEAAIFRYQYGASASSQLNLSEGVIDFGINGNARFALAEGKVQGNLSIPSKNGYPLFSLLPQETKDRGILKPDRDVFIKLIIGAELTGFIGASAVLSLPYINVKYKEKDKKAEAGVKGEAFAGASGSAEINAGIEWTPDNKNIDWKNILKGGVKASFSAGIGAKFDIAFKVTPERKVLFIIKAGAVAGLGGSADIVSEFDFKEGFDFMWYVVDSVDFHKAYDALEDTYKIFSIAKLAILIYPGPTGITYITSKGFDLLKEYIPEDWKFWDVDNKVIKELERGQLKTNVLKGISDTQLQRCSPETLGFAIRLIMQTVESEDQDAILKILLNAMLHHEYYDKFTKGEQYHKLRWTIRNIMGFEAARQDKESALKEGKSRLKDFFNIKQYKDNNNLKTLADYLGKI